MTALSLSTQLAICAFAVAILCLGIVVGKALAILGRAVPSIDEEETHG